MSKYKIGDRVQPVSELAKPEAGDSRYGTVTFAPATSHSVEVLWDNDPDPLSYFDIDLKPYVEEEEVLVKFKVGDKVSPKSDTSIQEAKDSKYGTVTGIYDQAVDVVWDNSPWSSGLNYWEGSVVPYAEEEEVKPEVVDTEQSLERGVFAVLTTNMAVVTFYGTAHEALVKANGTQLFAAFLQYGKDPSGYEKIR